MAVSANVGTLNIKIVVNGVDEANKQLNDLGKSTGGGGSAGGGLKELLSKFNMIRWGLLSITTAFNLLAAPIKITADHASKAFTAVGAILENSFLLPLRLAGPLIEAAVSGMAKLGGAAAAGFFGIGISGTKDLAEVDTAIRSAVPLFEFAAETALPKLNKQIMSVSQNLAQKFGVDVKEVANAFYDFASAGVPAETALAAMNSAVEFSIASQMNLSNSIETVLSTMREFGDYLEPTTENLQKFGGAEGIAAENADVMQKYMDEMALAVQLSQMRFEDLASSMSMVGPIAGNIGVNMSDVTAALAVFGNFGVRGSKAGTALATVLGQIARGSGQTGQALKDLGISAGQINPRNLGEYFQILTTALNNVGDQAERDRIIFELLGQRGAKAAGIFTDAGVAMFYNYQKRMEEAEGVTASLAKTIGGSLGFVIKRIQESFKIMSMNVVASFAGKGGFLTVLADKLAGSSGAITDAIKPIFDKINDYLVVSLPKGIDWLISAFQKASPYIMDIGSGFLTVFTSIKNGISTVAGDLYDFMETKPNGGATNWQRFKETLSTIWSSITSGVKSLYESVKSSGVLQEAFEWFVTNGPSTATTIAGIFDSIGKAFSTAFGNFKLKEVFDDAKKSLESILTWLNTKNKEGVTGLQTVTTTLESMGNSISSAFGKISEIISSLTTGGSLNSTLTSMGTMFDKVGLMFDKINPEQFANSIDNLAKALTTLASSSMSATLDNLINFLSNDAAMEKLTRMVEMIYDISRVTAKILGISLENPPATASVVAGTVAGASVVHGAVTASTAATLAGGSMTTGEALAAGVGGMGVTATTAAYTVPLLVYMGFNEWLKKNPEKMPLLTGVVPEGNTAVTPGEYMSSMTHKVVVTLIPGGQTGAF